MEKNIGDSFQFMVHQKSIFSLLLIGIEYVNSSYARNTSDSWTVDGAVNFSWILGVDTHENPGCQLFRRTGPTRTLYEVSVNGAIYYRAVLECQRFVIDWDSEIRASRENITQSADFRQLHSERIGTNHSFRLDPYTVYDRDSGNGIGTVSPGSCCVALTLFPPSITPATMRQRSIPLLSNHGV